MTAKFKYILTFLLSVSLFLTTSYKANSQGFLDKLKKKAEDALNKKVDKKVDDVLDGKKKSNDVTVSNTNEKGSSDGRPKLSELRESDFIQNDKNPEYDANNTRYRIAKNLLIDIAGKYPNGYVPKWRFINYNSPLNFTLENWLNPRANTSQGKKNIAIGDYNGKAVIRLDAFVLCHCFADIVTKDSVNVLTENPQTFEINNFRRILNDRSTGEPCMPANNPNYAGGWAGKITLSANRNGDITMDLMLENYSAEKKTRDAVKPSQVSIRYIAKGITVENEMSAEKATAIVVAEQEAKQRQKDYIAKTTKQADSLQKIIAKKYPQKDCRDCFTRNSNSSLKVTPTKTAYRDGYGDVYVESGTDWDINTKTEIKNKCGYSLTFIGLEQMYDEERGYYLIEVTKTMEKGYSYRSDQGAMESIFSSLVGGGSEFNIKVQDKYYPNYAIVGAVQWLKVVKK
jgi:hypothetical protein